MTYDSAAWGALALALTILGGILTWARSRSGGLPTVLRGGALSLVPLVAWTTGTLRLVSNIAGDISYWAVHLVFSPLVWLGILLGGMAVVLFGTGTMLKNRGEDKRGDRSPLAPAHGAKAVKSRKASKSPDDDPMEGMDDINAILRKHGIS